MPHFPSLSTLGDNSRRASEISASFVTAFVLEYLFKDVYLAIFLGTQFLFLGRRADFSGFPG